MPNRLAAAQSPYLRQHADNPVDWYEWGAEAFDRARAENKPIFLSIGYSTCHWCHVMAHECFENAAIADVLNEGFISIKVDREERPDVDRAYMAYVQAMTGHGGWPLSAWLTPDLKPFFGGTYFAPTDRNGRPGFPSILRAIIEAWRQPESREKFISEAGRALGALQEHAAEKNAAGNRTGSADTEEQRLELAQAAFERGYVYFYENFDAEDGGFGGAPKFPRASVLTFLFRCAAIQGVTTKAGEEALTLATHTLQCMARGGIHDHVGGGFHRYSVDERWRVPHFEKMLYDQAQIAANFLEARQATGDERYGWLARDILDYVLRDLRHPQGGFYSAEDADSPVKKGSTQQAEGAFYVWTKAEIDQALPADDSALLCLHFGVTDEGNVPKELDPQGEFTGKNILSQRQSLYATARAQGLDPETLNARLQTSLALLRSLRTQRPRPHLDDKVVTAWNGLAISAFARAHIVLERPVEGGEITYLQAAVKAAEFLHTHLYDKESGLLYRTYRTHRGSAEGFAEDYAFVIEGLLDLYEASFELRWLQWALDLQTTLDRIFWDSEQFGYFSARGDDPHLVLRLKEDYDGAEPTPSSVAANNLLRFAGLLGNATHRNRALQVLTAFQGQWTQHPQALPYMLTAVAQALETPRQLVLAGTRGTSDFAALTRVLPGPYGARLTILALGEGQDRSWWETQVPWLTSMQPESGQATAYLCTHFSCQAPVHTPEALANLLQKADDGS
ncbi:MAG TPA: thioredoxin domain-containing protein [Opitutaceae bacterium]|nr:thioredoxin domain-containing protein [Opitutaceae bacterium]